MSATEAFCARAIPKSWKSYLEGRVSTPQIIPKVDPGAIPHNKASKARERIPTFSDELSQQMFDIYQI